MKSSPEDILKSIPDFSDFIALSETIASLMYRKLSLEARLKEGESLVFKETSTNQAFFQGGKPPAISFIDNTYKFTGVNGELLPLRNELASVIAELEGKKLELDIYKSMIDVWRTLSSNQRTSGM